MTTFLRYKCYLCERVGPGETIHSTYFPPVNKIIIRCKDEYTCALSTCDLLLKKLRQEK